jgi:hypothetical protein
MASHLVKHTDIISSLSTSIGVLGMVVMELWSTHPTHTRLAHVARTSRSHAPRWWHPCRAAGASHVRGVSCRLNRLSIVDFSHSSNASASQSRVLVAVSPAVDGSLNQTSLSTKAGVQLSQSPANGIALSLVNQTVSSVLILAATSTRINAVLCLKFWAQSIHIH